MDFKKYNSIENSYQEEFINSIIENGYSNIEYVVQEKVHGANLSFITDGENILLAKRSDIIVEDEKFFNSSYVLEKYKNKILLLYSEVAKKINVKTISIFGELFGGGYPHPDINRDETAVLVQKGIYYSPSNDFYAFDILIDGEEYLNVDITDELFNKTGFIYAKTLFRGLLKDCLSYPNKFKTTLPEFLQLPSLEGNICEGVVIRPLTPVYLRTGSRVIIKNKNEMWLENNKYVDRTLLRNAVKEVEELSEDASYLCEEIFKYITENRLANVISKIGTINREKDKGKLLGLYNKDVLADFLKDYKEEYEGLEKKEIKAITKFLNKRSNRLIEEYFES